VIKKTYQRATSDIADLGRFSQLILSLSTSVINLNKDHKMK